MAHDAFQDLAEERTTPRICRLVTAPVRRMRHSDRGRGPGYFRPIIGYLAGCLKNPTELVEFSDIEYFQTIGDICRDYPAHLHINVALEWRNHGLGAVLVERFAHWARLHSVEGIHLVTSSASRRIPFCRRSGFRELRAFPWNSVISVCMGRKL